MKKILLIYNPVAGKGNAERLVRQVLQALNYRGYVTETFVSSSPGEATDFVRYTKPEVSSLLVAGGDGTLNEVLNGLRDPSQIPLAVLPTGTANVLARELALPESPKVIADTIEEGSISWLDMGLLGKRRFLLYVSVGLDAMISEELQREKGKLTGYWRYIKPVAKVLKRYKPPHFQVTVDGYNGWSGEYVLVSSTRNYGGGLNITDRARYNSGHLDVCIFPKSTYRALSRYYYAAMRGKLSVDEEITYLTGKRIRIDSEEPIPVQVDGDYVGTTPINVDLLPASVPFIVPNGNGRFLAS